jgi:hypothetical protein
MTLHTSHPRALALALAVVAGAATMQSSAAAPKFFEDDPIAVDRPTQDAKQVKPAEVKLFVDLTYNIARGFSVVTPKRAGNINTVDEVPDSSWFTNRIGRQTMSAREIAVGPNTTEGPASGTWTVTSSKSDGVTPASPSRTPGATGGSSSSIPRDIAGWRPAPK